MWLPDTGRQTADSKHEKLEIFQGLTEQSEGM